MLPAFLLPASPPDFPDPRLADAEGLVAIGGDLSPERLLAAYDAGIFPWYGEEDPPLWWSPDPRAVLQPTRLHVPRRLARTLRRGGFELTFDGAFDSVIRACAADRPEGTWITPDMIEAYTRLHRLGHVHSLEVWHDGRLTGGIYGVHRGGLFAAESMFHRRTDASKIALVALVRTLASRGVRLVDVQLPTPHLARFGAESWPRERYLAELAALRALEVRLEDVTPTLGDVGVER